MARPEFKPTTAQRHRVAVGAAFGTSQEALALVLGIDAKTLVKHFAHELTTGAYKKRQEVIEAMEKAAKKGNVAAAKFLMSLGDVRAAAPPLAADPEPPPATVEGKKAQAQAAAVTAQNGTDWEKLLPGTVQ